jgi:HEPN domain-containing protein
LTKEEYIEYWKKTAANDWIVVRDLVKLKHYLYAMFYAHLVLEKLCKAHWVKDNKGNYPPKIHNLSKLIAQTNLKLTEAELIFCADMNKFIIEGRYPNYISNIYKLLDREYTLNYIKQCKQIRERLLEMLE